MHWPLEKKLGPMHDWHAVSEQNWSEPDDPDVPPHLTMYDELCALTWHSLGVTCGRGRGGRAGSVRARKSRALAPRLRAHASCARTLKLRLLRTRTHACPPARLTRARALNLSPAPRCCCCWRTPGSEST